MPQNLYTSRGLFTRHVESRSRPENLCDSHRDVEIVTVVKSAKVYQSKKKDEDETAVFTSK